jgi:hypothetical protein
MKNLEEIETILGSDEPAGVVLQSADGSLFFLTEEAAAAARIPGSDLYRAYRHISPYDPKTTGERYDVGAYSYCGRMKRWLDTHSPRSARWRLMCLAYFDDCA